MKKNYNENLVAGAAIRDDKGRRISKLFEASHPKMTVGYAKNLIMPDTPTEQEFNFRQAGGGVIEDGVAVIDKVKGNSVVWNQLMKFGASTKTDNGITYEIKEDGRVHIYGTATARSTVTYYNSISVIISGHKYIIVSANNIISGEANGRIPAIETQGGITTCNQSDANPVWYFRVQNGVTIDVTFRPQLIDVTQMFGAGNEPSTYEEFLQRKPKVADEFAYNEGTIVNNKVEKVVTTGRNLWDEEWENGFIETETGMPIHNGNLTEMRSKHFIPIIGGQNYYISKGTQAFSYEIYWFEYDANFAFLGRSAYIQTLSAKSNTAYVRVGLYVTTSGVTVTPATAPKTCINLSDPTINGQYFPYEEHTLDLSWVKEIKDAEGVKLFEDGMRSAGTAFDEVGKNKAVKRIGVIDMGEMTWSKRDDVSPNMFASYGVAPNNKIGLCPIASINKNNYDGTLVDGILYWMGNYVMMYNSKFTTIDDFVNFVSGTPIYYELAEPVEVEYDEKSLTYPVVAGGTEEAIASEPSSAFRTDIGYGIDAVKTILDLKARVEALERK